MTASRRGLLLAMALFLGACHPASDRSAARSAPRGVILVLLDTVRADRLGCYGYARPTSPHLDALAAEGARFEQVVSAAPWTLPSVAGMLAGQYPERVYTSRLEASLVEALQGAGIATAAFTEGGFVSKHFGLDRGFDHWTEEEGPVQVFLEPGQRPDPHSAGGIERTFANAERWLEQHGDGPFFLLVHTYEPHTPYTHHDFTEGLDPGRVGPAFTLAQQTALAANRMTLTDAEREYVKALYDGDIASADRFVGRLLAKLDALGLADEVAVVVTSDHGEELGEHDLANSFDHGHSLFDNQVMVPLIVRDPTKSFAGRVVEAQVRTIDVLPTVVELLGVPLEGELDGRSLLPMLTGPESEERLAIVGHTKTGFRRVGLRALGHKYIRLSNPVEGSDAAQAMRQLYDLAADPHEQNDLAVERPQLADAFEQLLLERRPGGDRIISPEPATGADPALIERLKSLGYLQ